MSKVLICGSSFISRLEVSVRGSNFHARGKPVEWLGIPGGKFRSIEQALRHRSVCVYSVVVVAVGSNDLCDVSRRPTDLVDDLIALAHRLIFRGVKKVVICQLLHRRSSSHFVGLRSVPEYNKRIDEANDLLAQNCYGNISLLQHQHGVLGRHRLCPDGVHLNVETTKAFRNSILHAILRVDN